MLRTTRGRACLGCLVVLACGLSASAAPMTTTPQTATIPPTPTDWNSATASLAGVNPASFSTFHPTLGTLESVNLSLAYTYAHDVSMTFTNPATITVVGDRNMLSIGRPNGSEISAVAVPDDSVSQAYGGPTFPHTLTLPTQTTTGDSGPITLTSATDLALFTRSAPADALIRLPITAEAHSSFTSSNSNGGAGSQVRTGAVASLSYTYEPTPVPEPSTFVAFGLGVGGYLLARRNRGAGAYT